jgi:hypothetical protein
VILNEREPSNQFGRKLNKSLEKCRKEGAQAGLPDTKKAKFGQKLFQNMANFLPKNMTK